MEECEEHDVVRNEVHDEGVGEKTKATREERIAKKLIDPRRPTDHEVEEHNLTHIPCRNCCPICVRAKGKYLDHRKTAYEERGLAELGSTTASQGTSLGPRLPYWLAGSVRRG